jgi:SAM-dependent methyltransferase
MTIFKPLQHVLDDLAGAPFAPSGYEKFVFQWDKEFFVERVDMIGFRDGATVLDAGCGFGQFSYALARLNRKVIAIDRADWMLKTAKILVARWGADNIVVEKQLLPHLPYPDGSLDFIWCCNVMSFVDKYACMREFHRLLRPGGRVYVMINSWGRWLYKAALARQQRNKKGEHASLLGLSDGRREGAVPNYLDLADVARFCTLCGFAVIAAGAEGCVDLSGADRRHPMYAERIRISSAGEPAAELDANIEFVAERCG